MKNKLMRALCAVMAALLLCVVFSGVAAFAADGEDTVTTGEQTAQTTTGEGAAAKADNSTGFKAIAAAVAVGLAAAAGALGMGIAIAKSTDSMARQPEATDKINSAMMLGLVFIETTCIYALIVAILIIFVL